MHRAGGLNSFALWLWFLPGPLLADVSWSTGQGYRIAAVAPPASPNVGFTSMPASGTHVWFTNELRGDAFLINAVAHNGAGVALGDVDGDGWPDIYFCNLQGPNRLYRNLGGWRFQEMNPGDAACSEQLSTGATLADVDGDGDLDLLVNGIAAGTRLFLNDGKANWTEVKDSGLSRTASATSMALADIDGDGDLDLYCTHFIDAMMLADPTTRFAVARRGDQWEVTKVNGESARSPKWKGRFEALSDGKVRELPEVHGLYRNEGNGRFKAIENEPGVFSNEQGAPIPPYRDWGLAVMFRDINRDGFPDLYVCNDNTSPDRIWINSGQGTFRAIDTYKFRHTSRSAMGVDFGDINRDGHDDIIVVDMLAREHTRRVTQLVRDRPSQADSERIDERPQYNRNTLFFGRADGSFVEAAFMAGVAATDWTWTTIFLDVDLDGFEDLLVTNGFEFDVMDQDSSDLIKDGRRRFTEAQMKRKMQFHPRWRTPNVAFRNNGRGQFTPVSEQWGFNHVGISFGMAQADLDNDGDLDLVVNNLNETASLYRNDATAGRVAVRLKGLAPNTEGIGARVQLISGVFTQAQEMISGGRYLSSDQATRVFATAPNGSAPMRLEVRWRNGTQGIVEGVQANRIYEIAEAPGTPRLPLTNAPLPAPAFADVSTLLNHVHEEAEFDDWSREPMLPRRLSRLGPGVSWSDLDDDGWEDLVISSGRGGKLAVFRNEQGKGFKRVEGPVPSPDDLGAVLSWADGQGQRRLLVAQSQNETAPEGTSEILSFALNNLATPERLPFGPASPGPLATADIDGDGDLDLFVGGRFRPGHYPEPVASAIWINEKGKLTPSATWSEVFKSLGLVTAATFGDLDGDGSAELIVATEWGSLKLFQNDGGKFAPFDMAVSIPNVERSTLNAQRSSLSELTGWWTSVVAGDFDGDGRLDLACGNWGRNSIYALNGAPTMRIFHGDWSGAGGVQMVEAWRSGTNWIPFRDRGWLSRGLPSLAAQFPTHEAFGQATVRDLVGAAYEKTSFVEATTLASMVFLNRGGRFEAIPLPDEAQLSPVFSVNVGDFDADGLDDLFLSQNFFGTASDISRDDAGRGLWLHGKGDGTFAAIDSSASGISVFGEQRGAALADFDHDGRVDVVTTQNSAPTKLYANRSPKRGIRVGLRGQAANPDAIGARLRLVYSGKRFGPTRTIQAGSGYWSQDAPAVVLGWKEKPEALAIRWPNGKDQVVPIKDGEWDIRVTFEP